jgi:hypothetical protein
MQHAPWLDAHERERVVRRAMAVTAKLPMADTLAKQLGLTFADRQRLHITTIGAMDLDKAGRRARRKGRKAEQRAAKRHVSMRAMHICLADSGDATQRRRWRPSPNWKLGL